MSTTKFTDTTWASLGSSGLSRRTAPKGWTGEHDLAAEGYESTRDFCPLSFDEWRSLVSAAASGLPVELTWEHRGDRTTRTCIVEQFLSIGGGTTANLYVRSWGFAHPLALGDLRAVRVPEATYEFASA